MATKNRVAIAVMKLPDRDPVLEIARDPSTVPAMQLLKYTALRSGELRGARWEEFHDLDGNDPLWIIPAERMKMKREHLVPLSRPAVAVIKSMMLVNGKRDLVFASAIRKDKPISEGTLEMMLKRIGYRGRMVPHSWRSVLKTMATEAGWPFDVMRLKKKCWPKVAQGI